MAQNLRDHVRSIAHASFERGSVTNWFEELYRAAGDDVTLVPWADMKPNPLFVSWCARERPDGNGKTAFIIGCGFGDDAEAVAALGYETTAFDISPTAIEKARKRFPNSRVHYEVSDLLALPSARTFDFVLEIYTVQALPWTSPERRAALSEIGNAVAPRGRLLVICRGRDEHEPPGEMPWPMTRTELGALVPMLEQVRFEDIDDAGIRRFRAEYRRP